MQQVDVESALYREQMAAQGMHPQTRALSQARIPYEDIVTRTSILKTRRGGIKVHLRGK